MTRRDPPEYVNRLASSIVLEDEHAWPFRIVGVILDNSGGPQSGHDVVHLYAVGDQLFIAVQ